MGFSDTTSVSLCLGGPPASTESSSHLADLPAVSPCLGRLYSLQRLVSDQAWPLNLPVLRAPILGCIQGAEQGHQLYTRGCFLVLVGTLMLQARASLSAAVFQRG